MEREGGRLLVGYGASFGGIRGEGKFVVGVSV
jgi:hypothetical protein